MIAKFIIFIAVLATVNAWGHAPTTYSAGLASPLTYSTGIHSPVSSPLAYGAAYGHGYTHTAPFAYSGPIAHAPVIVKSFAPTVSSYSSLTKSIAAPVAAYAADYAHAASVAAYSAPIAHAPVAAYSAGYGHSAPVIAKTITTPVAAYGAPIADAPVAAYSAGYSHAVPVTAYSGDIHAPLASSLPYFGLHGAAYAAPGLEYGYGARFF